MLQQRAFATPNMRFLFSHIVEEIKGDNAVEAVRVKNLKTGDSYLYPTSGVFIYVGFAPNTDFLRGKLAMDNGGHIVTSLRMETSVPGVFACGDVRQFSDRQLGTAIGDGIVAALSAYRYISEGQ